MEKSVPWSEIIMHPFSNSAATPYGAMIEKPFYGSWNRLLNTLFPAASIFEVVPQIPVVAYRKTHDFPITFFICVNRTPVLFVDVRDPYKNPSSSTRAEADSQMRTHFQDIHQYMEIRVIYGVSAFGSRLAFSNLNKETSITKKRWDPPRVSCDPSQCDKDTPQEWWRYNLLEKEGAEKFIEAVNETKRICQEVYGK
ncbi:hypothetical protein AN958_07782 [Leucoagaricus sp. SymC.cos]|nr:hypothetical protein AN958_07782 [Leucoagaricus sp. SymC.cos]